MKVSHSFEYKDQQIELAIADIADLANIPVKLENFPTVFIPGMDDESKYYLTLTITNREECKPHNTNIELEVIYPAFKALIDKATIAFGADPLRFIPEKVSTPLAWCVALSDMHLDACNPGQLARTSAVLTRGQVTVSLGYGLVVTARLLPETEYNVSTRRNTARSVMARGIEIPFTCVVGTRTGPLVLAVRSAETVLDARMWSRAVTKTERKLSHYLSPRIEGDLLYPVLANWALYIMGAGAYRRASTANQCCRYLAALFNDQLGISVGVIMRPNYTGKYLISEATKQHFPLKDAWF